MNPALLALILTQAQAGNLNYALQAGEPYGLSYTLAGLEWQESSFCRFKGTSWSRGCLGLKRRTARIFDSGVTRLQLTDDNARNVRDGLLFLLYCKDHTETWRAMVFCYHWGLPETQKSTAERIDSDGYVLSVAAKVKMLEQVKLDTR